MRDWEIMRLCDYEWDYVIMNEIMIEKMIQLLLNDLKKDEKKQLLKINSNF